MLRANMLRIRSEDFDKRLTSISTSLPTHFKGTFKNENFKPISFVILCREFELSGCVQCLCAKQHPTQESCQLSAVTHFI